MVRRIPRGKVLSYGEVAERAGYPKASRAVGTLMKQNFNAAVPCHRVIRSDGWPGEYNRGMEKKVALLKSEGVSIRNGKIMK